MRLADIVKGEAVELSAQDQGVRHFLAYARVSTDEQERAGLSIPAQLREMQQYAQAKGIVLVGTYQEAESAFSDESRRPEFWRMVERAKGDPQITGILVHDHSRFYRDPYAGPQVKGELLAHGVRVYSATEPEYDPRTIAGLAIEKMTEFKNASYSIDVAFHTRKGMKENVARRDPEIGYCYKNGGAPIWGFAAYKVQRGTDRRGAPIMKTLWKPDETVVAGRPVWEWTRHALVELRLKQKASLDQIRDFLNDRGVPSPRKRYWATSSWHELLQPPALLQYAGYGVWNVHAKRGRHRPAAEWQIVERAHPSLLSLEEAEAILEVNGRQRRLGADRSKGRMANVRAQGSQYLLTGGLLVCQRCEANLVGYRNQGRLYYVCGAKVYRKGLGCGPAMQIRKEAIEAAIVEEVGLLFTSWTDTKNLMEMANEELLALRQQHASGSVEIARELVKVDEELGHLRQAIKGGLNDLEWANAELVRLKARREELLARQGMLGPEPEVPRFDLTQVEECRRRFAEVFAQGTNEERRDFARLFVQKIEVDPDTGDVLMHLFSRPPVPVSRDDHKKTPASEETGVRIGLVAGAGTQEEKKTRAQRWIVEIAFRAPYRTPETISRARRWVTLIPDRPHNASGSQVGSGVLARQASA